MGINHESAVRKTFGARVRQLREQRGWSLVDFAELARVSKGTISKIETGVQNVSVAQILELASLLNVPVAELFRPLESGVIDDSCDQEDDVLLLVGN